MENLLQPIIPKSLFERFPHIVEDTNVQSIQCPICLDVCIDAVIENACGHTFCEKCIDQLFKNSRNGIIKCPHTRQPIKKEQVGPNRALRDLISQIRVECVLKNKKCTWQGPYNQLEKHLRTECRKIKVKCPNAGCNLVQKRRLAEYHLKKCDYQSVHCEMCKGKFLKNTLEDHRSHCPCSIILCPYGCLQKVKLQDSQKHYNEQCVNKTLNCEFQEHGCKIKIQRLNYQEHLKEYSNQHLQLLVEKIGNLSQNQIQLNTEIESLKKLDFYVEMEEMMKQKDSDVLMLQEEVKTLKSANQALYIENSELKIQLNCGSLQILDSEKSEGDKSRTASVSNPSQSSIDHEIKPRFVIKKEGWVQKRSKFLGEWRNRWLVLTSEFLLTFQHERNYAHPTEKIPLKRIKNIIEENTEFGHLGMQIRQIDGTTFHFRTEILEERDIWIELLQRYSSSSSSNNF